MKLFNLFKKSKDIITENGINYIYYDNGKGPIKEKFEKKKGMLVGEYIKFKRNGEFNIENYNNGKLELISSIKVSDINYEALEEKMSFVPDTPKNKVLKKLSNLDLKISHLSFINELIEMDDRDIHSLSKNIFDNYYGDFDSDIDLDFITFYLIFKRNFFIKQVITSDFELIKILKAEPFDFVFVNDNSEGYQKTREYFNEVFKLEIKPKNNVEILNRTNILLEDLTDHRGSTYNLSLYIYNRIFTDIESGESLICESDTIDEKNIFSQKSFLFGLKLNDYLLIHELIENKIHANRHRYVFRNNGESRGEMQNIIAEEVFEGVKNICFKNH